ncbi:MAG: hypothetical protein P1V97_08420 [Planctomycetota bacterium]|nr:hypothetical protein [Planctomycetota bacterium]
MPLKVGLTETVNAFQGMPENLNKLDDLKGNLDALRDANLDHHEELVKAAAAMGVKALGFGELFTGPYFALERKELWFALAEDAQSGPTVTRLRQIAKDNATVLVAPIFEKDSVSGRRFNTAVFIESNGEVLGIYRKTHIPEGTNEQASFCETFYYDKSNGKLGSWPKNISKNPYFPVYESSVGKIAAAICYDRHFPGVVKTLAEQGAEIIFSPAVTFGEKSRRMWDMEFAVDACRHNVFIGGSNRKGVEAPWTQEYFGASHWVGPNGVAPNMSDHPNLKCAEINLGELGSGDPSGWDLARDLRPKIYG